MQAKTKRARRKPWADAGLSYFEWCLQRAEQNAPVRSWHPLDTPCPMPASAKPDLCALVKTVEAGRKVIWLSEGFPVDRSRYGRITLQRYEPRAIERAEDAED